MPSPAGERETCEFVVDRSNLRRCTFTHGSVPELRPGQALLRVDRFAFTANNVTYAVAGDMMSYWNFFPADAGWGKVPVWGFGDVVRSQADGVGEGERVYGYFPMATHLVVQPGSVTRTGFVDVVAHRQALPPIYNQYTRAANDPQYTVAHEAQQMLFRPLFMTAFLLDDFVAGSQFFGARTVVLSSASSKTALGVAFLLHRNRRADCQVIGLTSPGNVAFVEGLGCYDRVLRYDQIASLPAAPAVFVDMAGDGTVLHTLHRHLRDNVKHSCLVGVTHWEQRQPPADLPGAPPTFFFAPTQLQKRTQDWGAQGLQERYGDAWRSFLAFISGRIRIVHGHGPAAVERTYLETVEGKVRPAEGHVLSLFEPV